MRLAAGRTNVPSGGLFILGVMSDLDSRLLAILRAIASAYQVEHHGEREPLMHLSMGRGECFKHRGWPQDGPAVNRNDLRDLADLNLVWIEDTGSSWRVAPSYQGMALASRHDRDEALPDGSVRLDWQDVRPVLEAVVICWERGGAGRFDSVALPEIADELGPHANHLLVQRAVDMLEADGWVECENEIGTPCPIGARPTAKALGLARGWPGSEAALAEHVTTVLEQLIAAEPDAGKRRKLAMVRDLLIELGARTASELAGKLIGV